MDDASSQDTVVADYTKLITQDKVDLVLGTFSSLLNFPAPRSPRRTAWSSSSRPAGRRTCSRVASSTCSSLSPPRPAPGRRLRRLGQVVARGGPAEDSRLPDAGRPVHPPGDESMQKQLETLGVQTVFSEVYPADTTNFQTVASNLRSKAPDLIAQGAVFEDGVGLSARSNN
jgi:branched-chain amino acid transport system substrate-binding protein